MRFPSFPTIIRTFSLYNLTRIHNLPAAYRAIPAPFTRNTTVFRSMPTIPFLGSLFGSQQKDMTDYPVKKSDDEWQAVLSKEQFRVIREKGTEAPYTGEYDKHMPSEGTYTCAACQAPLYRATHKFKSGCGWPAYFDSIPGAVIRHTDSTLGMERTEITCSKCGGHLGHVFKGEGFPTPTDERHCVNSVSLNFSKEDKEA
ncbi:hypothetical protein OEA41_001916 [Lepraria neglecta]|uniref:Peptide-methionine (R)-S-oxide reductase n=1 Tax=Lepraria neglecta TaxID=209136 RepID=A0AAD9ZAL8_9LECA|nr:hypothetical protein OEA41_001916 [Lepraria neglecta]